MRPTRRALTRPVPLWKLTAQKDELRETVEWLRQEPKVHEATADGGFLDDSRVARLFTTSVGPVVVEGGLGGAEIKRFDDDGRLRCETMTWRRGREGIATAISAAGVPSEEAERLADEIAGPILVRWPEPPPAKAQQRDIGRSIVRGSVLYAVPWGVGFASAVRWLTRRRA